MLWAFLDVAVQCCRGLFGYVITVGRISVSIALLTYITNAIAVA